MATTEQNRARLIRLIHVARRDLSMAEDTYRAILKDLTGKTSSKDCSGWQLEKVVDHMKRAGFKVRAPKNSAAGTNRSLATGSWYSKVRAVWMQLHTWGGIDSPSEQALSAYVKRQSGVDDMRWSSLPAGHDIKILEGLKKWASRVGLALLRSRWKMLSDAGKVVAGDVALRSFIRTCSTSEKQIEELPFNAVRSALEALENMPDWKVLASQHETNRDAA